MTSLLGKYVRIITKVIFRNGREINTRYFGTLIEIDSNHVVLKENDGNIVDIKLKHLKRIEEHDV